MSEIVGTQDSSRRVRRSRDEWQRLINEQVASVQTQATFCAQRGISVSSFSYWRRRLLGEAESPVPWVDLGSLPTSSSGSWDVELDLGEGICLRLRRC